MNTIIKFQKSKKEKQEKAAEFKKRMQEEEAERIKERLVHHDSKI